MSVFHFFKIAQIVPNRVKGLINETFCYYYLYIYIYIIKQHLDKAYSVMVSVF